MAAGNISSLLEPVGHGNLLESAERNITRPLNNAQVTDLYERSLAYLHHLDSAYLVCENQNFGWRVNVIAFLVSQFLVP